MRSWHIALVVGLSGTAAILLGGPFPGPLTDGPLGQLTGTVQSISFASPQIAVRGPEGLSQFNVDSGTTIFVGGQVAGLSELRPGEPVTIVFELRGGRRLARWVEPLPSLAPDSH